MKVGWRRLLVVAVVVVALAGGAGYLGGNFETSWLTGGTPECKDIYPWRSTDPPVQSMKCWVYGPGGQVIANPTERERNI